MKKTADQVRKSIEKHYPKLKYIWLLDREYEIPTLEELEEMVLERLASPAAEKLFKLMKDNDEYDCDDYSLQLRAMIKARRPLWPVPECIGDLDQGIFTEVHSRFLCDTQQGLKVIDAEDGSIYDPDKSYTIFAVWG